MDMRRLMQVVMPEGVRLMIEAVKQSASSLNFPLYLVGGVVRDLHLGKMSADLDFIAVGSGIALAQAVAQRFGGSIVMHTAFGTAVWTIDAAVWAAVYRSQGSDNGRYPAIETIDFVTARRERYDAPAALPVVTPSGIEDDLARRDFTINTMALRLDGAEWGQLIDPFDGLNDLLDARCIRILHEQSFVDDPTRMFRAVRYATRLGLTLTPPTNAALRAALPHIAETTGVRLWHELEWGFREPNPAKFMAGLAQQGILSRIVPGLSWFQETAAAFHRATYHTPNHQTHHPDDQSTKTPTLYLTIWLLTLPEAVQNAVFNRLMFPNQLAAQIDAARTALAALVRLPVDAVPSQVAPYLERLTPTSRLALHCLLTEPHRAAWVVQYETTWRHLQPTVNGNTLKGLGLQPGPRFGVILTALKGAWLDGKITDPDSEQRYLQRLLQEG